LALEKRGQSKEEAGGFEKLENYFGPFKGKKAQLQG